MAHRFIEGAKGLTRNPLGIIALFISLIYGFACLVLSTSISNLEGECERLPLIWFIILFPLVILIAFIFLVVKHHEKLYSPSDFRKDEAFIQTMTKSKVREKQLSEISNLESSPDIELENNSEQEIVELVSENIPKEVGQQVKIEELSRNERLKIYANSEKWAIDSLTLKYRENFERNVVVNSSLGRFEFDALAKAKDYLSNTYVVEVKYWQVTKSNRKLKLSIQDFLQKGERIKRLYRNVKIVIVLVYDNLESVDQNDMITFVQSLNSDTIVEFFDYNTLKEDYE